MAAEPTAPRLQERPWWTARSRWALAFIVASNLAVLATIFVPEFSHWKDRHLQQAIAAANRNVEAQSRQVEVTRLLFDHFFGKSAQEQKAVVEYLRFQFPHDLRTRSVQAILLAEIRPPLKRTVDVSVASVQAHPVSESRLDRATRLERAGFASLVAGHLAAARQAFLDAFAVYPTYHNVDELAHRVLPAALARHGEPASAVLKDTIGVVLTTYSWGIPPDLLAALRKRFDRL